METLEVRAMLAGEFTDLGSSGIEPTIDSSMAWGDYDSDGDLDLVATGADSAAATVSVKLYRNDSAQGLTEVLPGFFDTSGNVTWADYDSDGNLDLLIAGVKTDLSAFSTQLYHNNGNGTFDVVNGTGLQAINGQAAWGDYDNDGRLDVAINGLDSTQLPVSKIYHNDGNGQFSQLNAGLTGLAFGSIAWGDANTDGRLDLLMTGKESQTVYRTMLYINNKQGSFTDTQTNLPPVAFGDTDWGDYDNDGDQDLLLSGGNNSSAVTQIFANDGSGVFSSVNVGFPLTTLGDANFGDYDNDGRLDVLLTGVKDINIVSQTLFELVGSLEVYRNNGNGTFSGIGIGSSGIDYSASAFGDYDNDGDIDFVAAGSSQTTVEYTPSAKVTYRAFSSLYQNNANPQAPVAVNSLPGAPVPLNAVVEGNGVDVTLSWSAPTDAETPSAGLSYNLRIGTTPGGNDYFSSMTSNGKRLLPELGRVHGTSYTLRNIPGGTTLYWSVQAIDSAFAGGAFSTEQSFTTPLRIAYTDAGTVGLPALDFSTSAWGDYDRDGDLDLLVSGRNANSVPVTTLYRNDGNNSFTDSGVALTAVAAGAVAWGDADNDGDLDIVLAGQTQNGDRVTQVFRNNGNNSFTNTNVNVTGAAYGAVTWGDADNDGDLDLLVTGSSLNSTKMNLYRNDGNFSFTEVSVVGLVDVRDGSVEWGDFDRDGDLDLLITGQTDGGARVARVYRNQGNFSFIDINAALTGVRYGSAQWGDADSDGDLDILLTGQAQGGTRISRMYVNNGNGTFSDLNAGLTGVAFGSASWIDADNDGDLDAFVTGMESSGSSLSRVYRNKGGNTFEDTQLTLNGGVLGAVSWADTDNDGDADILVVGQDSQGARKVQLYRGDTQIANTAPASPSGLRATASADNAITFAWNAPADSRTPQGGLSYNIRVGTTPGGSDVYSSSSNSSSGARLVSTAGAIQGTSFTLFGLNPGQTYYWSAQAIDSGAAGSPFATEQSLVLNFSNSSPVIAGAVANQLLNENAALAPFAAMTISDADTQDLFVRVSIENGTYRGDFSAASAKDWGRTVVGNTIRYSRYFPQTVNTIAASQAAVRALEFLPREGVPNTSETTRFTVLVNDIHASVFDGTTTAVTNNTEDAPIITGTNANQTVNDDATILPFRNLKVTDPDTQNMLVKISILNGVVRGDFTAATTVGWTRTVAGNNITYARYYPPQTNIGGIVQAAVRAMVFQPRTNTILPGNTESTAFTLFINDGLVTVTDTVTSVITRSMNNAPTIGGTVAGQTLNDNQTKAVFSTLTVTDLDKQAMNVMITIPNGVNRGDFTAASATGWTRTVVGIDIRYNRYFAATANIGSTVQAAIRALVFQPRTNVPVGTKETTGFTVLVSDGLANATNSTTSVITTGVAPRPASIITGETSMIAANDITTVVVPSLTKPSGNRLARLLKKTR